MKKSTKKWLITAVSLIMIGGIIFMVGMSFHNWNFKKLSTVNYKTNTHSITEQFNAICIDTDTANIELVLSDDATNKVVCYEGKQNHSVLVSDGTLIVKKSEKLSWTDYIGINFESSKITVYLSKTDYESFVVTGSTCDVKIPKDINFKNADLSISTGNVNFYASVSDLLKIKVSTGNIALENVLCGAADFYATTGKITLSNVNCTNDVNASVTSGKITLTNINCNNLITTGSTGDTVLANVIATQKFQVKRTTGDVELKRCDANQIVIETSTGDVEGTLLSDKIFIANTNTGDVDVPHTNTGGSCEITTKTGNIEITICND